MGAFETGGESRVILLLMIVEAEVFVYRFLPWHKMEKNVESVEECLANFCGWQPCQGMNLLFYSLYS